MPKTAQLAAEVDSSMDGSYIKRIGGAAPFTSVEDAIYQQIVELNFGTSCV